MGAEVFIVEGKRTPFGSFNGALSDQDAPTLGACAIKGVLDATKISPEAIGEVIMGHVLAGGCGQATARQAMRGAGIPDSAGALTINKVCGSGLKSIMLGANSIILGDANVVVAGGMESMSTAPYILKKGRTGYRMGHSEIFDLMIYDGLQDPYSGRHMGEIGEESAERNGLTRAEQDEFAARSYQLAQTAVKEGIFQDEIVPFVKLAKGKEIIISEDEEPFKGDIAKLPTLKTVFKKDGTITAGNASTINDGAAAVLLASAEAVRQFGLVPKARIVAMATNSMQPNYFPEAPVGAIQKVCAKAGISINDIDLFEINEAFASVALLAVKQLKIPIDKVNVNGGACAIGHPIGVSGTRLAITVVRELHRRNVRYGLATLCIGGGEAVAVIVEKI
ncbi:thiolase family protein [Chrysiogenes arsenatis]|uniref:thiolase family protein n=1 Tax=Chrysiogenes arsenatis TaxID=309797 RepID=UPI00042734A2|nr:thiolase family protein [Chrysiogenes arsenatis]